MAELPFFVDLNLHRSSLIEVKVEEPASIPIANSSEEHRLIFGATSVVGKEGDFPSKALLFCYNDNGTYRWEVLGRYKLNDLRLPDGDVDLNNNYIRKLETDPDDDKSAVNVAFVKSYAKGLNYAGKVIAIEGTPPGSPSEGDKYIVGDGTGDWAGKDNHIATFNGASWDFDEPESGWAVKNLADGHLYIYSEQLDEWMDFGEVLNYNAGDGIDINGDIISVKLADGTCSPHYSEGSGLDFDCKGGLVVKCGGFIKIVNGKVQLEYNYNTFFENFEGKLTPYQLTFVKANNGLTAEYNTDETHPYTTLIGQNIGDGLKVDPNDNTVKVKTPALSGIKVDSNGTALGYDESDFGVNNENKLYLKASNLPRRAVDTWLQSLDYSHTFTHDLNNVDPIIQTFVKVDGKYEPCYMNATIVTNNKIDFNPVNGGGHNFKAVVIG